MGTTLGLKYIPYTCIDTLGVWHHHAIGEAFALLRVGVAAYPGEMATSMSVAGSYMQVRCVLEQAAEVIQKILSRCC